MNSELIFEGKKYISARRASEICGYSSDYIGQLCRKGALDCRRVGRVWFVEEISLKSHQYEAAKKPRGRISIYQRESEPVLVPKITPMVAEKSPVVENGDDSYLHLLASLKQIAPEDCIDEVKDRKDARRFSVHVTTAFVVMLLFVFSFPIAKGLYLPVEDRSGSIGTVISRNIIAPALALLDAPYTTDRENIFATTMLSGSGEMIRDAVSNIPHKIHSLRIRTHALTLQMYHSLSIATTAVTDRMNRFAFLSSDEDQLPHNTTKTGIVVVPSTGSDVKDEQVKQYIKDSFSDETHVMPDGSGTSGAITPVFRSANERGEDEYMYVMVPVVSP